MKEYSRLEDLRDGLSNPDLYPGRPQNVAVIETHASIVFLVDNDVYKLKKPVDFGFLDYSTLEKRKQMCDLEVSLNRRLAPAVYRDVVEIVRGDSGIQLGGTGHVIDYLVHMQRLPEERSLSAMIAMDAVSDEEIRAVAQRIAEFHKHADHGPGFDRWGLPSVIRQNVEENFEQTLPFVGITLPGRVLNEISEYARGFLANNDQHLRQRIIDGMIRDGHGDLRTEHVYLLDTVIIVDCIEFNARLRCGDVAADIGFLAMDMDASNRPDFSDRLVREYVDATGFEVDSVLDFYRCYRAYVRAKVASFRIDPDRRGEEQFTHDRREARRFFHLAQRYAMNDREPRLILTSGLTGSGKSTLAGELAATLPAVVFDSDSTRKRLTGLETRTRQIVPFEEGIYSAATTAEVYQELFLAASHELARGRTVILDATYIREADRHAAKDLAKVAGAQFLIAYCEAPEEITRERLERRAADTERTSDGRWEIYLAQRDAADAFSTIEERSVVRIDTRLPLEQQAEDVLARLEGAT